MKHYYLEQHSSLCPCSEERRGDKKTLFDDFCQSNPESFVFLLHDNFIIFTYHTCIARFDKYDFIQSIIQKAIEHNKIVDIWETERSVNLDREFKNFRINGKDLRKFVTEVNYVYYDGAGKQYAITTKRPFVECLDSNDNRFKSYQDACDFLDKNERLSYLKRELKNLYYNSTNFTTPTESELIKSIDHITEVINKTINPKTKKNGNTKTSKHKGVVKARL